MLYEVFSASGVSSPLFKNCAKLIMERQFKDTGSQIGTMHKDLGITMNLARQSGVPMFTTAAAQQLFQAGSLPFHEEDNWCVTKVIEQIAGAQVTGRKESKKTKCGGLPTASAVISNTP